MKKWLNRATGLLAASLGPPAHELNEIDWKSDLSPNKQRLTEHLCAMANYAGGEFLVLGVGNDGSLQGLNAQAIEQAVGQLANLGRDAVEPAIAIDHSVTEIDGVPLVFVHVPESPIKPVHLRGKGIEAAYVRSGGSTRKASRQEIGTLMLHSRTPQWEDLSATVRLEDEELLALLDVEPILAMLKRPLPQSREEMLDWMVREGFIERSPDAGGMITNLGAIATARMMADFPDLSRKVVRVIAYAGKSKTAPSREQEGKRGYAVGFRSLLRSVNGALPGYESIINGLRTAVPTYPDLALREIIANALIHQDFTVTGAGPRIEIFDDRIEISNPGGLLPSKRLDRLIGTQPESRNERLARAFRRYRICEEAGSGLLKAGQEVELAGLPALAFEAGSNSFKVTLFGPRTYARMTPAERLRACYQHAVIRYYSNETLTNKSLRERLRMPEKQRSMVSVLIQSALDERLVKPADPENRSKKHAEYVPWWV